LSEATSHPTAPVSAGASADPHAHPNQFALLGQRRYAPFFWAQIFGAANDNLFKYAFTILVTYHLQVSWLPRETAGAVIGAVFILPWLIFSATSGQLADKLDKAVIVRGVKWLEIAIMLLAGWGFMATNVPVLLSCVFLMGLHSTIVGPVKYAYLPQHLNERELTGGNGMMEMGTFVAILVGSIGGGLLIALPGETGLRWVALSCLTVAVIGRVFAQFVPVSPPTDPGIKLNFNPVTETWANLKLAHGNLVVFRSLLGISWMWFFGAVFLAQFPTFSRDVLHGNEQVASLMLALFSIGVGVGALLCETLSHRHVEIGLVPFGAIGMSVFSVDLYFATRGLPAVSEAWNVAGFVAQSAHWRVMADVVLLSGFVGLFSVPMYALIQLRSQPSHRARIIAANNIINSIFMIVSAGLVAVMVAFKLTIPQQFLVMAVLNAVVAAYIFSLMPEYLMRFVFLILTRQVYRLKVKGDHNFPLEGPGVVICNHLSYADAIFLGVACPRPVRFIMDHRIFKTPGIGWFFKLAKAIPIAPQKEDPELYERAFAEARRVLDEGDLVGIFPEGAITRDGKLQPFRAGIMKILETHPVQVVPCALRNVWGSVFSRYKKGAGEPPAPRGGLLRKVELIVEPAMPAADVSPQTLQSRVEAMLRG
jgi:1-acyl-sn-glycerol-3-phosphate acyltransferase